MRQAKKKRKGKYMEKKQSLLVRGKGEAKDVYSRASC